MMMHKETQSVKHRSLIVGGLTSSAGIFISKAIGILYVIPFKALATDQNIAYYSYGYTLYDFALQITIAGIPVAVAMLIAKYYTKNDIATVLLIRKIARYLLFFLGLLSMLLVFVFATPFARFIVTENVSESAILYTSNIFKIISFAMLIIPILGSYRSFFQGLKIMEVYSFSQVLEQFVRVGFLLIASYALVVIFNLDPIWAVYMAILAASIAGLVAIVHLQVKEKPILKSLKQEVDQVPQATNIIIREIFYFSIPYLLVSVLGKSGSFVNLTLYNRAMYMVSNDQNMIDILFGMIMFTTQKIISIPTVLAVGFSAAIIPYVSEAITMKNYNQLKKNINEAISTVLYFAIPISAGIMFFATPIYYLFFSEYYEIGGQVLFHAASGGMVLALTPITTIILTVANLRKKAIKNLLIIFIVHLIIFFPLVLLFGYKGVIHSNYLVHYLAIALNLLVLKKHYHISYKPFIRRGILMLASGLIFLVVYQFSLFINVPYITSGKLWTLIYLTLFGSIGVILYVALTWFLQLPQTIFNIHSIKDIKRH